MSTSNPTNHHLIPTRVFGYLTVTNIFIAAGHRLTWRCLCVCGRTCIRRPYELTVGSHRKIPKPPSCNKCDDDKTYKLAYRQWRYIVQACYSQAARSWKRVGRAGIKMDPTWRYDFKAFHLAVGNHPEDGMKWRIERIDLAGDFVKDNCRWVLSPARHQRMESTQPTTRT